MSAHAAAQRYQSVQIGTSSRAKLVQLLLEGAIRFANEASEAMTRRDRARAGERLSRCHDILVELENSLDAKHAPELCAQLVGIYRFCRRRLLDASLHQSPAAIDDVGTALTPLRDAWAELATRPAG